MGCVLLPGFCWQACGLGATRCFAACQTQSFGAGDELQYELLAYKGTRACGEHLWVWKWGRLHRREVLWQACCG